MSIKSIAQETGKRIKPLLNDIALHVVNIWAVVADIANGMNTTEVSEFNRELKTAISGYDSLINRAVAIGRFMSEAKVSEAFMVKTYKVLGERIIGNLSQQKTEAEEIKTAMIWAMESGLINTRNVGEFKKDWSENGLKVAQSNLKKASKEETKKGKGGSKGKESDSVKLERATKNAEAATRKNNETKVALAKVKREKTEVQNRNNELAEAISKLINLASDSKVSKKRLQGEILEMKVFITETATVSDIETKVDDKEKAGFKKVNATNKRSNAAKKGIARKKAAQATK